MYIRLSLGLDYLLFARTSWIGWFTIPAALQTVFFLKDERSRKARIAGMVLYPFWTAVLVLCLFTDLIVTAGFVPHPYSNSPGPLEMPIRLLGSMMAFWLIYEIVRLRRQVSGYRRAQLSYYLFGTAIFGTGGAVVGGLLQVFSWRLTVRGVAMNPVDHPHGGGEGRTSGGRPSCTPWGGPTKGKKTRNNPRTDVFIVRRRSK